MSRPIRRIDDAPVFAMPSTSQAVVAGPMIYVSGVLGTTGSDLSLPAGVAPQTAQAIRNLELILGAAGAGLADIVQTTVYLTDLASFLEMDGVFGSLPAAPARTTVYGCDLPLDARIEIDAIAYRPEAPG